MRIYFLLITNKLAFLRSELKFLRLKIQVNRQMWPRQTFLSSFIPKTFATTPDRIPRIKFRANLNFNRKKLISVNFIFIFVKFQTLNLNVPTKTKPKMLPLCMSEYRRKSTCAIMHFSFWLDIKKTTHFQKRDTICKKYHIIKASDEKH